MNWDQVAGDWKQFQGKVKTQWGKLTDDQLMTIAGKRQTLAGKIQEAYGVSTDEAEKQIKQFEDGCDKSAKTVHPAHAAQAIPGKPRS